MRFNARVHPWARNFDFGTHVSRGRKRRLNRLDRFAHMGDVHAFALTQKLEVFHGSFRTPHWQGDAMSKKDFAVPLPIGIAGTCDIPRGDCDLFRRGGLNELVGYQKAEQG